MAFVELNYITAGYAPGRPVLRNFDLSVERGELLSLLGPSGCGKTTTLRTIAGFVLAQQGQVVVNGVNYTRLPPNKRNIGLVFQNYALFPHLSVFENVAYGLKRRHVARTDIGRRVTEALAMVSLTGYEDRLPAQLSGGQRQRVALARAVVIEPELLLLDEPLSNLDAKLRDEMRAELARLQNRLGITMIYVTHDQVEALSLSSRIVIMNQGMIEQSDPPDVVYERPATAFVARFMGYDNALDGVVSTVDAQVVMVTVGARTFRCSLQASPSGKTRSVRPGDAVRLMFRPDDVRLVDEATVQRDATNTLPVRSDFCNYQGSSTLCAMTSGGFRLQVLLPGNVQASELPGWARVSPDAIVMEVVSAETVGT